MQRFKKILAVLLCCFVLSFDVGSSYCYASEILPAYTIGKVGTDVVAWALLSALGIAVGESTGAVDYLTNNVWSPLVVHLKKKWGDLCNVFIDKTNNKSYVSKDMMQDSLDWGIENKLWNIQGEESSEPPSLHPSLETQMHHFYDTDNFIKYLDGKITYNDGNQTYTLDSKDFLNKVDKTYLEYNFTIAVYDGINIISFYNIQVPEGGYAVFEHADPFINVRVYNEDDFPIKAPGCKLVTNIVTKQIYYEEKGNIVDRSGLKLPPLTDYQIDYIYANMGTASGPSLQPSLDIRMHHFYDTKKFINYLDGKFPYTHDGITYSFDSKAFLRQYDDSMLPYPFTIVKYNISNLGENWFDIFNIEVPDGGYAMLKRGSDNVIHVFVYDKNNNAIDAVGRWVEYNFVTKSVGVHPKGIFVYDYKGFALNVFNLDNIVANMSTSKDYAIDSGLTIPKAGDKIDDWLAAQDKVNGGSVGLLGNDVSIPSDVTGTDTAIDALPLTIPSFADLVINGQPAIDDILSQGLVKANSGDIVDSPSAGSAVVGAEDKAATGENAEANAISVDQAQTALKNLMQQGIDYITLQIPNNFWNKIPFSIPYDIYLLIHGIFVGTSGGRKKSLQRVASNGSDMPVGDPSNVGIEIDIPTVPLKYTEEKTEDTPPNFTFALNIPYTTPSGETANFNKEFTIETAKYNYFAKIIKFSIGLLWLSSVFQWLLAIFSKG